MHVVWCVVCVREGTHQFVFLELLLVQDVPGLEPEVNESEQRHNLGTLLRITHTQEWSNSPTVPQPLCSWPYSNTDGYPSLLPLTITLLPSPPTPPSPFTITPLTRGKLSFSARSCRQRTRLCVMQWRAYGSLSSMDTSLEGRQRGLQMVHHHAGIQHMLSNIGSTEGMSLIHLNLTCTTPHSSTSHLAPPPAAHPRASSFLSP